MEKKLHLKLQFLQAKYPEAEIEVWSEDEHRLGLQLFNRVLADFAAAFQLNRQKRVLFVLDQAGWHISHELELAEGLDLDFLPPYSPELQPAERLWPLSNEIVANWSPSSIAELEELLMLRCQKLLQQQDLIKGLTCYHWWPLTRAS